MTCFTESVPAAFRQLIGRERHYTPHGVAFPKQFVFKTGGAPVWYVRGAEWDLARAGRPAAELSRMVRLWPGGDPLMPRSEWSHEREWRVLGDLAFTPADIAFVIAPSLGWAATVASEVELYSEEWATYWRLVPEVALGADGAIIDDPSRLLT